MPALVLVGMKRKEYKVVFKPSGSHVFVLPGTTLFEAAERAGLILQMPCGGSGTCGKCRVKVVSGECPPSKACSEVLPEADVRNGARLACQAAVRGNAAVEVPESALFESQQRILTEDAGGDVAIRPAIMKIFLEIPMPDQNDSRSDLERIRAALGPVTFDHVSIHTLRTLPHALRRSSFKGTAVVVDHELVGFEQGDTARECYGAAFDLGTTTIAGTLVELQTGLGVAVEGRLNPQVSAGDDVISRIRKCRENDSHLASLQQTVIRTMNGMIRKMVEGAGARESAIYEIVIAGNTTMQQIACGISPAALGELPFTAAFTNQLQMRASDLGLDINRNGRVHIFPQIGGFVGGDTVAGIVATRLDRLPGAVLLVDVGTNGEIVLSHDGALTATSVAAGPAFEGARISRGMRATGGAIEKVLVTDDVNVNVIDNAQPSGLCGSGLIDAVSELLRIGAMDPSGRILGPGEAPPGIPEAVRRRLLEHDGHVDFVLADGDDTVDGQPILLTQRDIRELQLANAAIRAGIAILMRAAGLLPAQLDQILVAGGFGSFIRRSHAQRIGLFPAIPRHKIRFVGNVSSLGAKRMLISTDEKEYAADIARKTRHLDLSLSPDFQAEFGAAMLFPS